MRERYICTLCTYDTMQGFIQDFTGFFAGGGEVIVKVVVVYVSY